MSFFSYCKESLDMLEVLVVNDGSKDLSSEIAHQFEKENPDTFRVIDKEMVIMVLA